MKTNTPVLVFGEALFDCFPDGKQVLGGAPFNVAWHLQALGNQPVFISRIGHDDLGQQIVSAMRDWKMNTQFIQTDPLHKTGQVEVTLINKEPKYTIVSSCAYDYISIKDLKNIPENGILYHGTLGLRNNVSQTCLNHILSHSNLSIFLDINLRNPWWQKQEVFHWLKRARWVKLNDDELHQLGFMSADISESMAELQEQFQIELLIVTQGEKGVSILSADGNIYQQSPPKIDYITDTVGAGDGFSALFIHGLKAGWSIEKTIFSAQQFASQIISLRGAVTKNHSFYQPFFN